MLDLYDWWARSKRVRGPGHLPGLIESQKPKKKEKASITCVGNENACLVNK